MKKVKFTWAHGVILLLGSFMIFIVTLLLTAGDTGSLITKEYYKEELKFQNEITAQERVNTLKKKPEIKKQANGIFLQFPKTLSRDIQGKVYLKRYEDNLNDLEFDLKIGRNHGFLIPGHQLKNGEYQFKLMWKDGDKEYLIRKEDLLWIKP